MRDFNKLQSKVDMCLAERREEAEHIRSLTATTALRPASTHSLTTNMSEEIALLQSVDMDVKRAKTMISLAMKRSHTGHGMLLQVTQHTLATLCPD